MVAPNTIRHRYKKAFSKTRKSKNRAKTIPSFPAIPSISRTIHPGDDFYKYINGTWNHHVKIPSYLSSTSVSDEIEEQINGELLTILTDAHRSAKQHNYKKGSLSTSKYLLGTLVESVHTIQNHSNVEFVRTALGRIQCVYDAHTIGSVLGEFMSLQIHSVLECSVLPSESETRTYRFTLGPGSTMLPDIEYYTTKSKKNAHILEEYRILLKHLGKAFSLPNMDDFVVFESGPMIDAILTSREDDEVLLKGSELVSEYPSIPWRAIVEAGLESWTYARFLSNPFLILSRSWLHQLDDWFQTLSIHTWKQWLSISFLLHVLSSLPKPYSTWHFRLFQHVLRGQPRPMPNSRKALQIVETWLGSSLGSLFVHEYVAPTVKANVEAIAKEIRNSAAERIGSTEWFSQSTRVKAKEKVRNVTLSVAYPSKFPKDPYVELSPTNLVENITTLAAIDFRSELKKVNTQLHLNTWDDTVFAVNAYYYNEGNHLFLPSGILRWPFYHCNASDGWNFGGIGATIGHELCHAFDDDGKEYDQHGDKNPWWTSKEIQLYKEKTNALIKLFSKTTYVGKHIDGEHTLSENIADLGGLSIALVALKERLAKRKLIPGTQAYMGELRDFFQSFTVSWRTKERHEKALQAIFMDVHAPATARVNNIVSQLDDWYECYDIQSRDRLYIKPEDRIRIF